MLHQIEILKDLAQSLGNERRPVTRPLDPDDLAGLIDLSIGDPCTDEGVLRQALRSFVEFSPDVSQVAFHKQLYSGCNRTALLGDWVASLANSVMHTYKMGPVATLMELEVVRFLNALVGFPEGDGLMVSGASQANLVAMLLARNKAIPDLKTSGYAGHVLTAFVSDQSHYSMQRAANVLGLGEANLRRVKSDEAGQLDPHDLDEQVRHSRAQGEFPFFIGLTAGTTVIGAFDPIEPCAKIARKHGMWLHIDGAWGAPVLFSEKHGDLLAGSELADSFTWDAHKFINVPLTAGIVLVKHSGLMKQEITGGGSEYLFHDHDRQHPNLGEMSIQSARRADSLKVWCTLKQMGRSGLASKMDGLVALKRRFVAALDEDLRFERLAPAPFLNVLFQYRPDGAVSQQLASELAIEICTILAERGDAFIDVARFRTATGIRLVFANAEATDAYLADLLALCASVGKEALRARTFQIASAAG